ncbi:hypothetical protein [Streptomyces albogriseolus]|uniref:hypothetical protein n=1 Tax=Streptomyces albogriseolus TaxID=1887 RepID=UPI0033B52709
MAGAATALGVLAALSALSPPMVSVAVAVDAPAGDLLASMVHRRAQAKDSANWWASPVASSTASTPSSSPWPPFSSCAGPWAGTRVGSRRASASDVSVSLPLGSGPFVSATGGRGTGRSADR